VDVSQILLIAGGAVGLVVVITIILVLTGRKPKPASPGRPLSRPAGTSPGDRRSSSTRIPLPSRAVSDRSASSVRIAADPKTSAAGAALVTAGKLQEALDLFASQGDYKAAGRVALRMKQHVRAAELFERAQEFDAAANAFLKVPDPRRAAECFALAKNHERAAEIYVQVGDSWAAADQFVLAGRHDQAAILHRETGNENFALKLEAEALVKDGRLESAAAKYRAAGETMRAAECLRDAGKPADAARFYQMAGQSGVGAQILEEAGMAAEAAALFEETGDFEAAARLYRQLNKPEKELAALVASGDFLAAGHLAYKMGQKAKATEVLSLATPADREYARICFLLGRIAEESARPADAVKHYAGFVERTTPAESNRTVFEYLATLAEQHGMPAETEKCLKKLESVNLLTEPMRILLKRVEGAAVATSTQALSAPSSPASDEEPRDKPPSEVAGRYLVQKRLGEGGTAVVFLATDKVLGRNVVLKFLSNPNLPEAIAADYFMREAQLLAQMSHPNLVPIYDFGKHHERPYIIMEYVAGDTLDQLLDKRERKGLPYPEVVGISSQVAAALQYAHDHKIIHRDLKPGNIMVLADGHAKLMDFGMAKAMDVHRTRSLYICGTPDYMSPEQMGGAELTIASDIYSFSLVVLELLLGVLPVAPTVEAARRLRLEMLATSRLPSAARSDLAKCLSLKPEARPTSAVEVVNGLAVSLGVNG
jgi:tRNA A-37 threonylcarbamoyl transferase component Bud32/tetratricopeptide (TPR) repeat protein